MNPASRLTKNEAACAISSGCPTRRTRDRLGGLALERLEVPAQAPGRRARHLACDEARGGCVARHAVRAQSIRPQPAANMYGQTARAAKNGPRRLTPITASHCSTKG